MAPTDKAADRLKLYRQAILLAQITVFYNLLEGLVSVILGLGDETLSLFGFGLDSFVEVISGIGIWHMVKRMQRHPDENPDQFEQRALRITGGAFFLLAIGLVLMAGINLYTGHQPETTVWGIIILTISILTMWALIHFKVRVGRQLGSDAILADAECTKTCLYLSFILLLASVGYELTGFGGIDAIWAITLSVFSYREGREAFEKASGKVCCGGKG